MLKTILISALAAILVVATGFSAYNVLAGDQAQADVQPQAGLEPQAVAQQSSSGQGYGAGGQAAGQGSAAQTEAGAAAASAAGAGQSAAGSYNSVQGADSARGASVSQAQSAGGQGNGNRRGQSGTQGGAAVPQPQNNMSGLVSYTGQVSAYAAPEFTLLTADGQAILVQLGNQSYVASLGLALQDGQEVSVTGFIDSSGALAVTSLTVVATGQTYTLRDVSSGRPAWAGGRNQ